MMRGVSSRPSRSAWRLPVTGSASRLRYEFCIGPSIRPANDTPKTSANPPAAIVQDAGELRDPGPRAVGGSLRDPQPDLRLALDRILPSIGFLEPHAEDPADRPPSHHGSVFLGAAAVRPRWGDAAARLVIGELNRRQLARRLHVRRTVG